MSNFSTTRSSGLFLPVLLFVSSTLLFLPVSRCQATDTAIHVSSTTTRQESTSIAFKTTSSNNANNINEDFEIYIRLGVPLPTKFRCFGFNRWSWKMFGRILTLLHFNDKIVIPDMYVNLRVLWCKALSSFHPKSPSYEGPSTANDDDNDTSLTYFTYSMLPLSTRWIIRYFWPLYPRWMHANIELRTAYINQALTKELIRIRQVKDNQEKKITKKICLIVLGSGYDPRAAKLLLQGDVDRVYELDLPSVVSSKKLLLDRAINEICIYDKKQDNTRNGQSYDTLSSILHSNSFSLEPIDLNDINTVESLLQRIKTELIQTSNGKETALLWHVIVVSEALLLYLERGNDQRILQCISQTFREVSSASFIFADRLGEGETRGGTNKKDERLEIAVEERVRQRLRDCGWQLKDFMEKPGATRHLGIATTN